MRCYKCGQTIEDTASFCRFCGTSQGAGATTVLDSASNPFTPAGELELDPPTQIDPTPAPSAEPAWQSYKPESAYQPSYQPEPVYQPAPAYQPTPVYQPEPVYQPAAAYQPEPAYQPAPTYQPMQQPAYQPQYSSAPVYTETNPSERPRLQLPTHRSLVKMIFLPLLTFGIYGMVIWSRIVTELNIVASRHDGKRTMPYFGMTMLMPITLGIHSLVWIHGFCNRIGDELRRRNIPYEFGASTFWLWNVLGSLIVVGPFIYQHKLMKSMNLINADFNEHG